MPLNCAAAVDNIRSQVDTMVENGQKNLKGGYITQAQFDATAGKFREARTHATVADCQASTGRSKAMYQCMSNSYNHLIGCAESTSPEGIRSLRSRPTCAAGCDIGPRG